MHPNTRIVHKAVEYFTSGNLARFPEVYSEDVVIHIPPGNALSGEYRGLDRFVDGFIGGVMERVDGVQLEVHDIAASDDHATGLYRLRAERNGNVHEWQHVNVYHLSDGKITEIWWTPFDQQTVADLFA